MINLNDDKLMDAVADLRKRMRFLVYPFDKVIPEAVDSCVLCDSRPELVGADFGAIVDKVKVLKKEVKIVSYLSDEFDGKYNFRRVFDASRGMEPCVQITSPEWDEDEAILIYRNSWDHGPCRIQ